MLSVKRHVLCDTIFPFREILLFSAFTQKKQLKTRQWRRSNVFTVRFDTFHTFLVFILLTVNVRWIEEIPILTVSQLFSLAFQSETQPKRLHNKCELFSTFLNIKWHRCFGTTKNGHYFYSCCSWSQFLNKVYFHCEKGR